MLFAFPQESNWFDSENVSVSNSCSDPCNLSDNNFDKLNCGWRKYCRSDLGAGPALGMTSALMYISSTPSLEAVVPEWSLSVVGESAIQLPLLDNFLRQPLLDNSVFPGEMMVLRNTMCMLVIHYCHLSVSSENICLWRPQRNYFTTQEPNLWWDVLTPGWCFLAV